MENILFSFETQYDFKTFIRISKAAVKTVRKQSMLTTYLFALIVGILFIVRFFPKDGIELSLSTVITWTAFILMLVALIFQHVIEAHFLKRATRPEDMQVRTLFGEDEYILVSQSGEKSCKYSDIEAVAEIKEGFILMLGNNIYKMLPSESLKGGTTEDFRAFIEKKTGKNIRYVK